MIATILTIIVLSGFAIAIINQIYDLEIDELLPWIGAVTIIAIIILGFIGLTMLLDDYAKESKIKHKIENNGKRM